LLAVSSWNLPSSSVSGAGGTGWAWRGRPFPYPLRAVEVARVLADERRVVRVLEVERRVVVLIMGFALLCSLNAMGGQIIWGSHFSQAQPDMPKCPARTLKIVAKSITCVIFSRETDAGERRFIDFASP
jgi:hypothetical protein